MTEKTELELKVEAMARKVERLEQALDQTRRRVGLPAILDEQVAIINARTADRGKVA
jgi:hypothetical protein